MNPQTFFIIGATIAFSVYGVFKLLQLRKRKAGSKRPATKMRPKGTSQIVSVNEKKVAEGDSAEGNSAKSEVEATKHPKPVRKRSRSLLGILFSRSQSKTEVTQKTPTVSTKKPAKESVLKEKKPEPVALAGVEEEYPYFDQSDYQFGGLTPSLAALMPTTEEGRESMTRALRNAGYYTPHAWHNLTAVRYLCMVGPILLFGCLLILVPEPLETSIIIAMLVTSGLGWALPSLYVRAKAKDRLREIGNGMPDMLDLLNMCVSQGMTVTSALRRVGGDIEPVYPALAKELKIVTDQAHIGTLSQSLTNLSDRVDLPEVHSFSSLLVQTDQMGTSVSEALAEYSDNMRESMKQRADEKANSATFKLLFPTVLCLMPAVYLFLLGPAVVELNRFYSEGGPEALNTEIPDRFAGG